MKYKKFFWTMLSIAVLGSLLSLLTPLLLNHWRQSESVITMEQMGWIAAIMILVLLMQLAFIVLRERFAKEFNKANFFESVRDYFRMNYDALLEKGAMNLLERMIMAVNSSYTFLTGDTIQIWSQALILVVATILIAVINPWIAIILALMIPFNYFLYRRLNRVLHEKSQIMQKTTGEGWQKVLSAIGQVDYIKQVGEERYVLDFLEPPVEKIYRSMAEVNIVARSTSSLLSGINLLVQTLSMVYVVYLYSNNETGPFSLVLLTLLLPIYFQAIASITNANLNKRDYLVAKEFQEEMKQAREADGAKTIDQVREIRLDVEKLLTPGREIETSIHERFHPGDIVWIQGDSGSGKSTLAKALVKFRLLDGIRYNEMALHDISNESLRTTVEYLSQNVPIVQGTLRENLFFAQEWTAKKEASLLADPLLKTIFKDKTMDTVIQMDGSNLSGGEKQRIALIRALYAEASVLILDEITANIDKESAREIYRRVEESRENRMIFIISHDDYPSAIANHSLTLSS